MSNVNFILKLKNKTSDINQTFALSTVCGYIFILKIIQPFIQIKLFTVSGQKINVDHCLSVGKQYVNIFSSISLQSISTACYKEETHRPWLKCFWYIYLKHLSKGKCNMMKYILFMDVLYVWYSVCWCCVCFERKHIHCSTPQLKGQTLQLTVQLSNNISRPSTLSDIACISSS